MGAPTVAAGLVAVLNMTAPTPMSIDFWFLLFIVVGGSPLITWAYFRDSIREF